MKAEQMQLFSGRAVEQQADMSLLSTAEREQLLIEWNDTRVEYPQGHCVHALFEQCVERNPDSIALVHADIHLSYGELNRRANQLAHYLQRQGVGPEIRVGLCLERSLDLVIAIIAVLKAGGCYVPVDVSLPEDRMLYQLHDAQVRVVITQAQLVDTLSGCHAILLSLNASSAVFEQEDGGAPQTPVEPANLAYVVYTSGSTGRPKGTMITHASLCNLMFWHVQNFGMQSTDRATHLAGLGFDASVWELWPPLVVGASLTLLDDPTRLAPEQLFPWFAEQAITISFVPTPLTERLLEEPWPTALSLRILLTGGDRLHRISCTCLPFQLMNNYGPTEATVVATSGVVEMGDAAADRVPDIGRAIANMQVYVLDEHMQPVPIGAEGELYLGGVQLARGYLNRPELTAERFVPHPFSAEPGARLYRTGDVVRYLPGGRLDFVGRNDFQVKMRGYRIELGEIEHALLQHSSVRECIVIAREDRANSKQLVAYVVLKHVESQDEAAVAAALQAALHERLPEYMVPSAIMVLDALPLNVNGKVDRHALPAPKQYQSAARPPYGAPQTEIEQALVRIWSQVLRLPQISIHDNFFALGGDSILGISLVAQAREAGLHMTVKQLYQAPTIAQLSSSITPLTPTQCEEQPVSQGTLTLTPILRWFFELRLANPHHWNQAFLFQVPLSLSVPLLEQALHWVFTQHDIFRVRFTPIAADDWQAHYQESTEGIVFSFLDLTSLPEDVQVQRMTELCTAAQSSLHIGTGPLARAVLFRLSGPERYRLLVAIHHLAIDTVSWRVLLDDVTRAYRQLLDQQPLVPLKPSSTFQRWAEQLVDYVQTEAMQREYPFWLRQQHYLERPEHTLPVDDPAGGNTVSLLRIVELELSTAETHALLRDIPQHYRATIEEILLAALELAFHDAFGRSDIVIDMEGHGREELFADVDLSRTVGWFTSKFPVILDLGAQPEPIAALRMTKAMVRQIPQRGIGYGLLRYLHPDPAVRSSLQSRYEPQVSLNYLGQFDQVMGSDALFPLASEPSGWAHGPENQRIHQLYVLAMIVEDRLHISWQYSAQLHRAETIQQLTRFYLARLRQFISLSQQPTYDGAFPYIPDDFPLLHISQSALDQLLSQISRQSAEPVAISRQVQDLYPLSGMQAGLLFHSQAAPYSGLYEVQVNLRLEGPFHLSALIHAWQQLIVAHPMLRTSFIGEEPLTQVVWQHVPLPLMLLDYSELSPEEQQQQLQAYQQEDRRRGFVEQQAPLLHLTLFHLGPQQLHLLWSFHHAILDAWSITLLLNELFARYEMLAQGQEPIVPASRSYRDYIAWLQQQDQRAAEQFWREELRGFTEPTPLPLKQPHLSTQRMVESTYGKQTAQLSPTVSARLRAVARELHVTVNTLVQASWAFVLSRYSGQSEVLFGMVVAGRSPELIGAETVVGLCVNTVPVRISVPRQGMVGDWLRQIHERLALIQHYDYYPLVQIQGVSEVAPGLSLFESIFAFENHPVEQLQYGHLRVYRSGDEEQTHYPLAAVVLPGQQLELSLSYQEQLMEQETVARMLGLWQEVLEVIGQQFEQPITDLPLLTATEWEQLLITWNATICVYPQDQGVYALFAQQAARQPDAIALVQGEAHLSYGVLAQRAAQLAAVLQHYGVGPDTLVALCLERSLELVVAIVAVLHAGGAYVPMDPTLPPERLRYQLADAQVAVILTQGTRPEPLTARPVPVLDLAQVWPSIAQEADGSLPVAVQPQHLAYVIYTSGSTGRPKGTMLSQQGLTNLVHWHQQTFGMQASDRSTQLAGLGFDASVWELWPVLATGASLTLLDDPAQLAPAQLVNWLARYGITVSFVPTPIAEQLLEQDWPPESALRVLLTGGDRLQRGPQQPLPFQLINNYGPTEATVVATSGLIEVANTPPDIGRAIANTQLYVLDAALQPVPLGVVGELYLGGVQLARGYLHQPVLTAERFVPDPFSGQAGARLYRTGDLVRYRMDGQLEFVGRRDFQVKLRGFRIELGEIEQVLLQHLAVRECVVVAHDEREGDTQLLAYVVPATGQAAMDPARLRSFLQERLPDYMVPAQFIRLDTLPLTANGKVDRRALPPPQVDWEPGQAPGSQQRPDPIAELLAGIWQTLLPVPEVSAHDNFFALGGHSLLAMQVLARIRQQLAIELPLRTLLEAPTLGDLAVQVQQQLRHGQSSPLPPLRAYPQSSPPPLSFAQERFWFLEQLEPGQPTYHIPLILRLEGALQPAALNASLRMLEARHEVLRMHIAEDAGQAVQGLLPPGSSPLRHVDLSGLTAHERADELRRLARQEAHQPFDLRHGPLWRSHLLHLDPQDWVLLLTMHHSISDGWSMQLLLQELTQYAVSYQQGNPAPLAALPLQYADYARWQREWLRGERLEDELAYWREQLAGLDPLQLPTDHPRPAVQTFHGAREHLRLSAALQQRLQALSRQEGVTLFMTLLAGWLLVLQRYSGQHDLAVGTPIANRNQAELEELIGCFVNTLVLRCTVEEQASVRDLLAQVREVTLGAYSHQEVPFERVVEALQPQRELSHTPLFQVSFAEQQDVLPQEHWEGISLRVEEPLLEASKFDLSLFVQENRQGIDVWMEYSTDLFEAATVKRMLMHWQQALEALVQQPDQRVADVSLLTDDERDLLLREWNATTCVYPQDQGVYALFAQQAARQPDAIAVVQGEAQLSYGALAQRAAQLAQCLQHHGVGPDTLVALCLERSLELVVASVAVLHAGGAYVPMDPTLPPERLRYQLADAQVAVILTQGTRPELLTARPVPMLDLAQGWPARTQQASDFLPVAVQPQHLAYVIYTSGSTGRPKGTLLSQQGLHNLVHWHQQAFGVQASDRSTQLAGLGFDASVWELWPVLATGASLTLLDDPAQLAPTQLVGWLARYGITVSFVPTPIAEQLLEQAWPPESALRVLLTGGDRLQRGPRQPLPFQLINNYGPTEATVVATSGPVLPSVAGGEQRPDIGRALANTQLYVLDEPMQPVPLGVVGELYLGGVQLARGYLHQPVLTAERFVPDPFSGQAGARLYRTGDLVRYRSDGRLEFVGRRDFQVKLRGFRIELGEIEQVLLQHPALRECVVVAHAEREGDTQLVAYVVPVELGDGRADWWEPIRAFLGERLPAYMVPTHFIRLDALPLTANGKVDRAALPAPEHPTETQAAEATPRNTVEQTLTELWCQVLRLPQVGIHDNFFALGGDSILSLALVAQARQAGLALTVKQLFQAPTIAQLSHLVSPVVASPDAVEPERTPSQGDLPLTPIQHWFFAQHFANPHHWNQAFLLQTPPDLALPLLEQALQWVFRQHDVFRLRFTPPAADTSSDWQAHYLPEAEPLPLAVVDLREVPAEEQASHIAAACNQAQASLHLEQGPLVRAVFFQREEGQPGQLLLVSHHLVIDTVSWRILLEDLSLTYARLQQGMPLPALAASSSYQAWAQQLHTYAQSEALDQEAAFWLEHVRAVPSFPVDNPTGANHAGVLQHITQHLSSEDTHTLLHEVAQRTRASVEEVLLTALAMACSNCFGSRSFAIDLEGHGREPLGGDLDLSRTVGWFTSVYPIVLEVGPQPEPVATLRMTKAALRRIPQRGVGYGIVRYLHPDPAIRRRLQAQTQPAISFNYLGQFDQVLGAEALFMLANEEVGGDHAPENQRVHQLDVVALIVGEQLHLSVQYSAQLHYAQTMQRFAQCYLACLQQIIVSSQATAFRKK